MLFISKRSFINMKRGTTIILMITVVVIIILATFIFSNKGAILTKQTPKQNESLTPNLNQSNNIDIEQATKYEGPPQFILAFPANSIISPYEKIFVYGNPSQTEIDRYSNAIQKTRTDLANFVKKISQSQLTLTFEEQDKIGFGPGNLPILADSNIRSISLANNINEGSVTFIPEYKYTNDENSTASEDTFTINQEESIDTWMLVISWKNEYSEITSMPVIKLYSEHELLLGEYSLSIKIRLENTTIPDDSNLSRSATIKVFAETSIVLPTDEITINKTGLENSINSEQQIIFLGADWLIDKLYNSCEGIEYPGASNMGVAEYISSRLNSAISDADFAKKEGMQCPLKEITSDKPQVMFVKNTEA